MPSPPSTPVDLLRALSSVLGALHLTWYVFGAQAVVIWGRPRMTADVDVTVRLQDVPAGTLVHEIEGAGFKLRIAPDAGFIEATRVLPCFHEPSGFALDVVLAGPGLEESFLDRAVQVDLGGVVVPVIAPGDLIVTKMLAGRPKDIEDARGILLAFRNWTSRPSARRSSSSRQHSARATSRRRSRRNSSGSNTCADGGRA
jgi:hypothetical protein